MRQQKMDIQQSSSTARTTPVKQGLVDIKSKLPEESPARPKSVELNEHLRDGGDKYAVIEHPVGEERDEENHIPDKEKEERGDENHSKQQQQHELVDTNHKGNEEPSTFLDAIEKLIFPPHSFGPTDNDAAASSILSNSTPFLLNTHYPEVTDSLGEAFRSIDSFVCGTVGATAAIVSPGEENPPNESADTTHKTSRRSIFGFTFPSFVNNLFSKDSRSSTVTTKVEHSQRSRMKDESSLTGFERKFISRSSPPSTPPTPSQRRSVREIYSDIRDLRNERLTAQPEILVDIDLALEVLRCELKSVSNATRAANNNVEDEDDDISICDSISSIHQSISKIQINANANAQAMNANFSAMVEQNRVLAQSVQVMQQQMAMLTIPVRYCEDNDDELDAAAAADDDDDDDDDDAPHSQMITTTKSVRHWSPWRSPFKRGIQADDIVLKSEQLRDYYVQ